MKLCHAILFDMSVIPMVLTLNPQNWEIALSGFKPAIYLITWHRITTSKYKINSIKESG